MVTVFMVHFYREYSPCKHKILNIFSVHNYYKFSLLVYSILVHILNIFVVI